MPKARTLMRKIGFAAMIVVTLAGCGVVRQQQAVAARQQYADAIKQAGEETKAAMLECKNKRLSGELKTYVASAQCSNPMMIAAFQKAGYRYMDLVNRFAAKRVELSEKVDNHQLTEAKATLESAEYLSHVADEERHRNLEIINAQSNANRAAAQEDAANRQVYMQMMNSGLNMMGAGQQQPSGGRVMCTDNKMASGTMPNPVVCQNF
jgi:hypothetical protein